MRTFTRTFVAIPIDPEPTRAVGEAIGVLRKEIDGYRWVDAEAELHLTLVFLGDVPTANLPEICSLLGDATATAEPFELELRGVGAFPDPKRPRILWFGCADGSERIRSLQTSVADCLELLGYRREERPFTPHLTIGRSNRNARAGPAVGETLARFAEVDIGTTAVRHVHVMESELSGRGPRYTVLATLPLLGTGE